MLLMKVQCYLGGCCVIDEGTVLLGRVLVIDDGAVLLGRVLCY